MRLCALLKSRVKKDHCYLGICPSGDSSDYLNNERAACDLLDRFVFEKVIESKNDWDTDIPETAVF